MPRAKFSLRKLFLTKEVTDRMAVDQTFSRFVAVCLGRHAAGDSGDLSLADIEDCAEGLKIGRTFSASKYKGQKLWIMTEPNRSTTITVLEEANQEFHSIRQHVCKNR